MIELSERIYVAGDYACPTFISDHRVEPSGHTFLAEHHDDWAIVHACKSPCHQRAVGYRGNPDKTHPNYLVMEQERDLYRNMIDPPVPMFPPVLFSMALRFVKGH